jgi:hypothetical protein
LPDWEIAEILNAPDETLPPIISRQEYLIGFGTVLAVLGAEGGAAFLDTLTLLATTNSAIKWGLKQMERGALDISLDVTRQQIDALAAGGALTSEQAEGLKGLADVSRYPSWAEHNEIEVTARNVGLTRGAA